MKDKIKNGTIQDLDGKECIFFDGYWVRYYHSDVESLANKKQMIDLLTRRVFHNVEPGINTPGHRVEEIRDIYNKESCAAKKRVKGAMLAGSLLNRGRDILKSIVELEEAGIKIETNNELLEECGKCFIEALELGKNIKLIHGDNNVNDVNELWGEPFRVFSLPIEEYYQSRYIKIAQTMAEIDQVSDKLISLIELLPLFIDVKDKVLELSTASKLACETLRNDSVIFEVWPRYVIAKEAIEEFTLDLSSEKDATMRAKYKEAYELIKEGGSLMTILSSLRVPIPVSVKNYIKKCDDYIKS
ncbi:MAG: hypothetical protein ACPHLK_01520 [Gammaproteobacteria bacterium]|jgi:hypothetical protein